MLKWNASQTFPPVIVWLFIHCVGLVVESEISNKVIVKQYNHWHATQLLSFYVKYLSMLQWNLSMLHVGSTDFQVGRLSVQCVVGVFVRDRVFYVLFWTSFSRKTGRSPVILLWSIISRFYKHDQYNI